MHIELSFLRLAFINTLKDKLFTSITSLLVHLSGIPGTTPLITTTSLMSSKLGSCGTLNSNGSWQSSVIPENRQRKDL